MWTYKSLLQHANVLSRFYRGISSQILGAWQRAIHSLTTWECVRVWERSTPLVVHRTLDCNSKMSPCCSLTRSPRSACKHPRTGLSSFYRLFSLTQWGESDQPLVLECSMKRYKSILQRFQLKHKAATSHWDQFRTSVLVLARPHCVKDGQRKTRGMCCFSPRLNSLFAVPLSPSASGVCFNLLVRVPRSSSAMGRERRSCPGRFKAFFHVPPLEKEETGWNSLSSRCHSDPVCVPLQPPAQQQVFASC